jgi:hypothetical protein
MPDARPTPVTRREPPPALVKRVTINPDRAGLSSLTRGPQQSFENQDDSNSEEVNMLETKITGQQKLWTQHGQ